MRKIEKNWKYERNGVWWVTSIPFVWHCSQFNLKMKRQVHVTLNKRTPFFFSTLFVSFQFHKMSITKAFHWKSCIKNVHSHHHCEREKKIKPHPFAVYSKWHCFFLFVFFPFYHLLNSMKENFFEKASFYSWLKVNKWHTLSNG